MNTDRLLEILEDLLHIHSPSKNEIHLADYVINFLHKLGVELYLDENYKEYGGNTPTIFAKLPGNLKGGVTFSAHMDVIEPNENLIIIKEKDKWKTDGATTLGSDDKAGLAAILYLYEYLIENEIDHKDTYAIITPAEEIGMLGAQSIKWDKVYEKMDPAKDMIVLDSRDSKEINYQAPTGYNFFVEVHGKTAHAGLEPEKGRNAITMAASAISQIQVGRIDEETTSNISKINSDFPGNVVPDYMTLSGEVRSHDKEKAIDLLDSYEKAFEEASDGNFSFERRSKYPALKSKDNLKLANKLIEIYKDLGVDAKATVTGGGTDANFFSQEGFNAVILGVGMTKAHTREEYLNLEDLFNTSQAIINYLTK